jgi:hypothetical protein
MASAKALAFSGFDAVTTRPSWHANGPHGGHFSNCRRFSFSETATRSHVNSSTRDLTEGVEML